MKNKKKINLYKTIQLFSNKLLGKYNFSLIEEVFPALFVKPKSNIKKQEKSQAITTHRYQS